MATTIVFACKSNSCRSQMAEGWAKYWLQNEKTKLEERRRTCTATITEGDVLQRDRRLQTFLDGLVIASVALDESSITSHEDISLSASPTSSITSFFAQNDQITNPSTSSCVTCDGETSCSFPLRRKKVKSKAIEAMAKDGVDISDATPKTIHDVLSSVSYGSEGKPSNCCHKKRSFSLLKMLRSVSLQMSLAYAGVTEMNDESELNNEGRAVDSLVVLCSCSDSMKQKLSDMSKETLEWNIDAPTAFAKEGEGDGAYLRVSRQIREQVELFMDRLKENIMAGEAGCCENEMEGAEPFACARA